MRVTENKLKIENVYHPFYCCALTGIALLLDTFSVTLSQDATV